MEYDEFLECFEYVNVVNLMPKQAVSKNSICKKLVKYARLFNNLK
jgi:hypothetical protein